MSYDFARLFMRAMDVHALLGLYSNALRRVNDSLAMGWSALAESWQRDADAVLNKLEELHGHHTRDSVRSAALREEASPGDGDPMECDG